MKIVIEIPKFAWIEDIEDFKSAVKEYDKGSTFDHAIREALLLGTPLPKGHGDLKDAEKLKNAFIIRSIAVHGNFTDADIASIIYNSPTIIEADKCTYIETGCGSCKRQLDCPIEAEGSESE